jgi:hypothetical protein
LAVAWQVFGHGLALAKPLDTSAQTLAPHRVLLLVDEPGDPFVNRVLAEISTIAGLDIVLRPPAVSIEADARSEHAQVAIRKLPSGKGVEVWMADATTGRSLIRQVVVDESPDGPDPSLVALQTAELLRTSLFSTREATVPVAPPPPPSPPIASAALAPPAPGIAVNSLQAGVGWLGSRGGVSPALQAWLSYQRLWSRHIGIALDMSAPLARGAIRGAKGSADLGALIAGGGVVARWESERGHLTVATTLGGAFAKVLIRGQPIPSYVGESTSVSTGLVYLRVHGSWKPVRWLGFGAAALIGSTTSRIHIEFNSTEVGEWGTPFTAAVFSAELDWD